MAATKKIPGPATVAMVEEAAATGRVREIYEDIKATKQLDFVPNLWKNAGQPPSAVGPDLDPVESDDGARPA